MAPPIGYLETGVIYCDDNLERLSQFPAECIDLIYLDPPFFSNRHYEVIWGDEAEVRSFEDRWEGGIQVYVNWMRERMIEIHRVLKPTGTVFLHCDHHASHYLKVMMDAVFDRGRFLNEIVWHYTGGGRSQSYFSSKHVVLFWYAKGTDYTFNVDAVRVPYKETSGYAKGGITSKAGKHYSPNPKGTPVDDVWDIPIINPLAKERLGYPTQKPEALLDRIVLAASNRNDIVCDPFAGCGTTLVVAERHKRQWIGIDISPTAVELMRKRMSKVGASNIKLVGMPVTEAQLRELKPFEFQNWVVQRFNGTHSNRKTGDMGIDGYSFMLHEPIQVKQSPRVGRNVVDNFETAVERDGKTKGYIVAFSFTRGAHEEAARVRAERGLEIQLMEVADLLKDTSDLVTPAAQGQLVADVPLPKARPADKRPSVEQLVESDQSE